MKITKKARTLGKKRAALKLGQKEKKALQGAIQSVHEQSNHFGFLDPLELEPVLIYSLEERRK